MKMVLIMRNKFLFLSICIFAAFFAVSCGKTSVLGSDYGDGQTSEQASNGKDKPQTPGATQTPGSTQTPGPTKTPETPQTPGPTQTPQTPEPGQPGGGSQTPGVINTRWFVSQTGSNSASGDSAAAPLATVRAALDRIKSLYRAGNWPAGEDAVIVISGKITASSGYGQVGAMVDVSGAGNYPPIILEGDPVTGGILDANKVAGNGRQVLFVGNNKVTVGDKLVLTGGRSLWGGAVCIGTYGGPDNYSGEFIMTGGEIRGNSSGNGGGVMIYSGSMSMRGGLITGNDNDFNGNEGSGGGVYVHEEAYFTMSGGKISGNGGVKTDKGGGLLVNGKAKTYLTGGEIINNKSDDSGGGVYVAALGEFTMSGGTISGNASAESGGVGVSQYGGIFNKSGGLIAGNTPNN
jgi:hypothetical protein